MFTTGGRLNPIRVTDTRAGNPGWNLSGQMDDFTDNAAHWINGANVGVGLRTSRTLATAAPEQERAPPLPSPCPPPVPTPPLSP
ncbi:WxL domain-containing protein [Actinophytocola sp.]|uniref:WxL domain-containing protein n=1 Tax=Actinophytocola sp. TaxID=1872138 RepID=UPI002D7E81D0|nr:WxL domain-containing protein [Actinophytocola sp.]HET9144365.1 WxL domain-containing protein [Actinophytocola sp.]